MLPQYYEIIIKDNNLGVVEKIDFDTYKKLKKCFDYVYHSKNGESYPLDKDLELCRDILLVDDKELYRLIDDLIDQGFCDTIEFSFIDDYFSDNYNQYGQAF